MAATKLFKSDKRTPRGQPAWGPHVNSDKKERRNNGSRMQQNYLMVYGDPSGRYSFRKMR